MTPIDLPKLGDTLKIIKKIIQFFKLTKALLKQPKYDKGVKTPPRKRGLEEDDPKKDSHPSKKPKPSSPSSPSKSPSPTKSLPYTPPIYQILLNNKITKKRKERRNLHNKHA